MASATDSLAALLARFGQPAPQSVGPSYGTQAVPLDSFTGAAGSGNKTTNKDLPEWLRKLGMKGDAYAGGMLKPQIRYGFWYKDGKINFADGTSFAAKKNKDGSFAYTDAAGKPASYSPTDEQNAYNKKYQASTSNQSFLDKATNAVKFELDHGQQILKGVWDHPQQAIFGVDPIGTKIGNAVTGDNATPQVDQLGGALNSRYADYENRTGNSTGFAKPLQGVAHTIAAAYGANGLTKVGGKVLSGIGTKTGGTGEGLGVFSNGGKAGIGSVGLSNAGNLAAAGGIGGGAGIGGTSQALGGAGTLGAGENVAGTSGTSNWMDWIGPLINAGTSLVAGNAANGAIKDASAASIAEQRRQFDTVRSDTAPARALGAAAIGRLAALNGYNDTNTPDFSSFTASPDYQFNLSEGQKAIDRSAAARNGLLSGAAVKEGTRYAQGTASREYAGFVDRLMQQAGLGSTGIAASAASGANAANNISATTNNAGNARASIYQDTGANVNNAAQSGISNYMLRRYIGG